MTKVRIFVTYKQSVFDPQGETITEAVHSLGHDEVKEISEQLLVNFNLETYRYEIMEED